MRGGVAGFERHRSEVPHPIFLVAPEGLVKNLAPIVDHGLEQTVFVECGAGRTALGAAGIVQPVRTVPGFHACFDKGGKAAPQVVEPALNALEGFLFRAHVLNHFVLLQPQRNSTTIPFEWRASRWLAQSLSVAFVTGTFVLRER